MSTLHIGLLKEIVSITAVSTYMAKKHLAPSKRHVHFEQPAFTDILKGRILTSKFRFQRLHDVWRKHLVRGMLPGASFTQLKSMSAVALLGKTSANVQQLPFIHNKNYAPRTFSC